MTRARVALVDASAASWGTPTRPAASESFNLTDSGNAEYFAALHGQDLRYDHRRGHWLLWRQHRWRPDTDAEIRRLAKAAMRQRLKDAAALDSSDDRSRAVKWALRSESRPGLDALLNLAQAEPPIADAGDRWDVNPWLLGATNGVVDLKAGQLRPGHRDDRITMSAAVPFDQDAVCPRLERFIEEVFAGEPELPTFIQRAVGYSLTGQTGEQCLFICYGAGSNGKTTLLGTLAHVFGDYAWNMPFSTIELQQRSAIPNDLAALDHRRFVSASETNDGTRLNESRVKALTGSDQITARHLHCEFFTFQPVAKFWLAVNHRPIVRDDSHGLWRRIRLVPFERRFEVDQTLGAALRAEASGILAWAVRGCLAWQRDGLDPPAVVTAATREYETDSDPLADFIDGAIDVEPGSEVQAADLFDHYKRWAERQGLTERERMTSTMLGRKMAERFGSRKVHGRRSYLGLARRVL